MKRFLKNIAFKLCDYLFKYNHRIVANKNVRNINIIF